LKIALVNWYSTAEGVLGGTEIIFDDLKRVLERQGHDAELITFWRAANALQRPIQREYSRYAAIDRAYLLADYLEQREKLFGDIDLVISADCCLAYANPKPPLVSYTQNPYLESGKISSVAAFTGMRAHLFYNEFGRFYVELQHRQIQKSAKNVCCSEFMMDYLKRIGARTDNAVLIPHGVDTELFKPLPKGEARARLGIPEDARVGMANTAVHPIKGWHTVAALCRKMQNVVWVIVLKHPAPRRPKLGNVRLFARIPRERLPELYSAADFLVNPSYCESFALAPIEAMACGVPAIVSRTGFAWHLKPGEFEGAGQIVGNCNDLGAYERAIGRVFGREWGPREWVLEHGYDAKAWAGRWEKLIEAVG